jgi:hypothetical protein
VIRFACARCAAPVETSGRLPGRPVICPRCRHLNVFPPAARIDSPIAGDAPRDGNSRPRRRAVSLSGVALIAALLGGWTMWRLNSFGEADETASASPSETLQRQLLREAVGKPGDGSLGAMYQRINLRHFGGTLPAVPVRWEPGLARVGPLAAHAFTLEGMFGHINGRAVILLNPSLQADRDALERALCHEMVHLYLHTTGDSSTDHGPAFQATLRRLSNEGAFTGIPTSDEQRAALRVWLDTEAARLDAEQEALAQLAEQIERERADVEAALDRVERRREDGGLPSAAALSDADRASLEARREAYNQRAMEANRRIAHNRRDLERFNDEVARYNLMLVYPDGVDQHQIRAPKPERLVRN